MGVPRKTDVGAHAGAFRRRDHERPAGDRDLLEREPAEWEFRAKPMWARMLVLSAGVIMDVLLAIVIFWGVNYVDGKITRDTTEVGFVAERSPAASAGFAVGDRILFINGKQVSTWDDIERQIYLENLGNDISFEIERGGKRENLLEVFKIDLT